MSIGRGRCFRSSTCSGERRQQLSLLASVILSPAVKIGLGKGSSPFGSIPLRIYVAAVDSMAVEEHTEVLYGLPQSGGLGVISKEGGVASSE